MATSCDILDKDSKIMSLLEDYIYTYIKEKIYTPQAMNVCFIMRRK